MELFFRPICFIENLPYLVKGMVGIFAAVLIIWGITKLLGKIKRRNEE